HDISFFIRPFFENREASSLDSNNPQIHFSGDHILAGEYSMRPLEECNLIKGEESKRIYLHKEAEYGMEKFFLDVFSPSYYRIDSSHNIKLDLEFCFDGDLKEQSAIPRRECSDRHMNYLSEFSRNFIVSDNENTYIMAGYPWFGPWGRDTFISLPGLLIYHKEYKIAENIIDSYCRLIKDGIIPNVVTDTSDILYNTADASLWLINSIYLLYIMSGERRIADKYYSLINNIVFKYRIGTFNNIFMDKADLLISAGSPHTQLTWMDASRDGVVFTPRYGKTVEINALWYNSICIFQFFSGLIGESSNSLSLFRLSEKIRSNFMYRFWNDEKKYLNDYISTDSSINSQLRPNQLYALSLPFPVVNDKDIADAILNQCEKLLTPNGVRTLSPDHSDYKGEYCGNWFERDSAYHQGTAWSFLYPVYIEALLKRHRDDKTMKEEIRKRLQDYTHKNIYRACVGYLPEIWNGSAPYIPHGTPAQAWSTAEMLRVWFMYFENN
ncbi:MAG: amylo-alpha-1,6-glucosidase, partial [Candidatus Muiribacteriaceae bacterium]